MKVGVVQICSKLDYQANLDKIKDYLTQAKILGIKAVFLPEVFYSMSNAVEPTPYLVDPVAKNEHYENIQRLASDSGLYILGGSAASLLNGNVINRNYNFAPDGTELEHYDKMNLFAVNLAKTSAKTVINEADVYTAGNETKTLEFEGWKMGLSICFDLRFPEMFRHYSFQGVNLLTISAAFTVATGKAHWQTLLRARAIENQCYVIAPAQWGKHNDQISTWGHSLIIDPWGEILANAKDGEALIHADISLEKVEEVRSRMKVLYNPLG